MTDEVSKPAVAVPVQGPVRRTLRTAVAVLLRLVLVAPLRLTRALVSAVGAAAEKLDDGLWALERLFEPVCRLPLQAEILRRLDAAEEDARLRLLRAMKEWPRF